ncbi:hypothetical protein RUM44_002087 [Polyplax serrata]|uniref:ALMS motif domain-containing protein n=1 Tax=Polyplax serrata TaxID=468196 RepID=A0ABR1ALX6_POLSC
MPRKRDGNVNPQNTKVIQLGFNISVSGDPNSDFQIVLDDKKLGTEKNAVQLQTVDVPQLEDSSTNVPKREVEKNNISKKEIKPAQATGPTLNSDTSKLESLSTSSESIPVNKPELYGSKEFSIIDDIKNTMEHFDKFSDHIKEIPRFKICPLASSTPFSDKQNSKSEPNLMYSEQKPRKLSHACDYGTKKDIRATSRHLQSDLFLRPLPGADLYRRGMIRRYDYEPFSMYRSVDSLTKPTVIDYKSSGFWKSSCGDDKYDFEGTALDDPVGILKKSDTEVGEKSNSSAESIKDIKIYQSGGILIMQNFKDNLDGSERKEVSDYSAKLIENCNKLKEEIEYGFPMVKDRALIGNSSEESQTSGKMVQFDLLGSDYQKNKLSSLNTSTSKDDSPIRAELIELATCESFKNKDAVQGNLPPQDFTSMSTQENDSIVSNPPGMSPGASGKKLEWDSGADVGYLNLDLSKENLSTIERIVLRGLSSDGTSEKDVVYEKMGQELRASKFILERKHSDVVIEEIVELENQLKPEKPKKSSKVESGKETRKKVKREADTKRSNHRKPEESEVDASKDKQDSKRSSQRKHSTLREVRSNVEKQHIKSDPVESVDKSVSVNTLFLDENCHVTSQGTVRHDPSPIKNKSSKLSPKIKKLRKKIANHRFNLANIQKEQFKNNVIKETEVVAEIISSKMGVPKRVYKTVEAKPELGELERSRETEEIIVEPCVVAKQDIDEIQPKEQEEKENKIQTSNRRPNSSSSTKTVLQKAKPNVMEEPKQHKKCDLVDQVIQTSECEVESVGVQAFSSQKSGMCGLSTCSHEGKDEDKKMKTAVNTSSKNIQVFGLNSSLPKQLAHPKECATKQEVQNTKSTQFFGGPINSLPNYHSNLVTKPGESCGRMLKVLNDEKSKESELTCLNKEIRSNLNGEKREKRMEPANNHTMEATSIHENKENGMTDKSKNPKKSENPPPRKDSNGSEIDVGSEITSKVKVKNEFDVEKKKSKGSSENSAPSDGSCKMLTSKHLKEHGDSIDRNLIQEKYFQSQLIELEKREMISKSTSVDGLIDLADRKQSSSVACQYSLRSTEDFSNRGPKCQEVMQTENVKSERQRREGSDSSPNFPTEEQLDASKGTYYEADFGTGDSFPSSTQTAHSWVPGIQDPEQNKSAVGRARSFEYLPGHIYESSGNLREKLPSENGQNLISGSSSDSSRAGTINESERMSEGRNTLVLENSNETLCDTDRLKSLDNGLNQLHIVLTNLREKDDKVEKITRSLLVNLCRNNGSESPNNIGANSPRSEIITKRNHENSKERQIERKKEEQSVASTVDKRSQNIKEVEKERDVSIACQTEDKSSVSSIEKYYEKRKALESRIAADKESQIKWIEKEINHLNVLRGLLEKQTSSSSRKKKSPNLTLPSQNSVENDKISESIGDCAFPSPVQNSSNTATDKQSPAETKSGMDEKSTTEERSKTPEMSEEGKLKYGMAVSLNGNLRKVILLPVGVQVSKKNGRFTEQCSDRGVTSYENVKPQSPTHSVPTSRGSDSRQYRRCKQYREITTDVTTQCPSTTRHDEINPSISVQTDFTVPRKCSFCQQKNCVCLSFSQSEKSDEYISDERSLSKSSRKASDKKESLKPSLDKTESSGQKITFDSIGCDTTNTSGLNRIGQRYSDKTGGNTSESVTVSSKSKSICKCETCPKSNLTTNNKHVSSSHNHSHSKVPGTPEKSSPGCRKGTCRCSNIQVQKSSGCACHVIKILGPRCCTPETELCSCKRRNMKSTENQYCQTDEVIVEQKNVVMDMKLVKPQKEPEVILPCEGKIAVDNKIAMESKCLCCPKLSYGKEQPVCTKTDVQEKFEVKKQVPEAEPPVEVKTALAKHVCDCQKKEKESAKTEDHPRHYFLKIEETEMDESNESIERRSLEVITVKVPVKKAGAAKIYGSEFKQSPHGKDNKETRVNGNLCNCCEKCIGRTCRNASQESENRVRQVWHRQQTEKPDVYKRNGKGQCDDRESYEDLNYVNNPSNLTQLSSSSQEGYQESSSCYTRLGKNDNSRSDTYSRQDGKITETPSEYDSHKEYIAIYDERHPNVLARDQTKKTRQPCDVRYTAEKEYEVRRGPNSANGMKKYRRTDTFDPEYYDYNKKEFMTKSELMKEEQQKKRTHQPTLQEYLESNRPDFYSSAESRRRIISERAKERAKNHENKVEYLMNLLHRCNTPREAPKAGSKRIFTTPQMREQTMKRYRQLPEVTEKVADQKKKEEYKTNKLMADIFAKKLQIEALKGHINLSNSVSVLSAI